ncbi:molybdenum cofactor guanylyltransferase [Dactylosporangium sucinum]|uniref:MobA-like NTP transferase domain-containing protein n=1 Tax=Dactylosporangium sucinum TaxID=1424081 RepID=A0A917X6W3_9ACTN|nr:NTP transferase domain-containing protein [Dactylosporangium sucinum]GGM83866.1 hypothetical protein GCM10007977_101600 [Dactylosporangium sucinum]
MSSASVPRNRPPAAVAAVVLAGGPGRRMGGRDKPMVPVDGVPMLARVLTAVAAIATEVVVVGPDRGDLGPGVLTVQEQPPGGGPVAGLDAGLAALRTAPDVVLVLAADLPRLDAPAVRRLVGAVDERDGAVFVDGDGRRQVLCGAFRSAALRTALSRVGDPAGVAVRQLIEGLDVGEVGWDESGIPPYFDCDTEADLRRVHE